jgi:hypothetical protein
VASGGPARCRPADASGEQFGRVEAAGLQPFAFSLCRRTARDGWHARILTCPEVRPQLGLRILNPTPKAFRMALGARPITWDMDRELGHGVRRNADG